MSEPGSLVAKFRVPLDEKDAGRLARTLVEYPNHALRVAGVFLEVHEA